MSRLERIQRVSAWLRYLLLGASTVVSVAIILAIFIPGQDWLIFGDGSFTKLWNNGKDNHLTLMAIMVPIVITLVLGVFWLQRLFSEYQAGCFFTDGSMRCYVWLIWLKVISFVYGAVWPVLLEGLSAPPGTVDGAVSFDAGTFVEIIILLLIVHLLKEAQLVSDENKAFI
jgi:hypothetical protein